MLKVRTSECDILSLIGTRISLDLLGTGVRRASVFSILWTTIIEKHVLNIRLY